MNELGLQGGRRERGLSISFLLYNPGQRSLEPTTFQWASENRFTTTCMKVIFEAIRDISI